METKQTIPAGTRWGALSYICDIECSEKKKRPLLVRCEYCGIEKKVDLAALRQNPLFATCGSSICRRKMQESVQAKLLKADQIREDFKSGERAELSDLTVYWREIERTGNVHNVAKGLEMTTNFLKK
jgi:hypothetical protein